MRAVFIFAVFLAIVLHIQGKPVETTEELENWEAPVEIQTQLRYYLSGYDEQGRPVWIFEVGKYPFLRLLNKGPETVAIMEKYFEQAGLRIIKSSATRNPANGQINVIFDFEGAQIRQVTNPRTISFIVEFIKKIGVPEGDTGVNVALINVNPAMKSVLKIAQKGFGQLADKLVILGRDKSEWENTFLKMIPADQLPEWYGGSRDFKPVKVYGHSGIRGDIKINVRNVTLKPLPANSFVRHGPVAWNATSQRHTNSSEFRLPG
ncbi:unnamed protein product [Allacma fusca]|uniref:CRAL-TRIO domain-containing protein n=1 Tax=Allacma fusca TaxID=39272 RepID=A0A8J2KWM7_9HEXA|nr:unnamed protein product [Allacma fusca]